MFKEITFARDADSSSRPEEWLREAISHVRNNQSLYRVESDTTVFELTLLEKEANSDFVSRLNEMTNRINVLETRQAFLLSEIRDLRFQLDLSSDQSEPEVDEDLDELYDEVYLEAMELKKLLP